MGNKRKPETPPTVRWVHSPCEGAETEFWKLYLRLSLEALLEAAAKGQEDQDDRKK